MQTHKYAFSSVAFLKMCLKFAMYFHGNPAIGVSFEVERISTNTKVSNLHLIFTLLAENNMPSSWRPCDWPIAKSKWAWRKRMQLNELGRTGLCSATPGQKALSDVKRMD